MINNFQQQEDILEDKFTEKIHVKGDELLKKVKELIHQGNIRRIIIKDTNGKTYLELPLNIGVVGAILAPAWAALGALAAIVNDFTIELIKKDDSKE